MNLKDLLDSLLVKDSMKSLAVVKNIKKK